VIENDLGALRLQKEFVVVKSEEGVESDGNYSGE